jgi:hypothetical protein
MECGSSWFKLQGRTKPKTTNLVFAVCMLFKGEFAVVPTDKICGRSLSSKIPVDMNSIFMKLYGMKYHYFRYMYCFAEEHSGIRQK